MKNNLKKICLAEKR